ncbi:MAG: hypothetical protein ACT4OE_02240 [Sphingosinicella sp.]
MDDRRKGLMVAGLAISSGLAVLACQAEFDADAELRRWLAGGWAEVSTNCETDTGEHFNADGRYGGYGRQGYWRIEGGRLIVRVTHEPSGDVDQSWTWVPRQAPLETTHEISRRGPDRMELLYEGERAEMMRCPLSHFEFTIPVRA